MGDVPEQQDVQQEEKPKSKLPLIIISFVILLGIIIFSAMSMLSPGGGDTEGESDTDNEIGYMYSFPEPFTNNLLPPDDQYLVTVEVTLEIKSKPPHSEEDALLELGINTKDKDALSHSKMPKVVEIINTVFQTKNKAEVTNQPGKERIKAQIKNGINAILEDGKIESVILEKFIIN